MTTLATIGTEGLGEVFQLARALKQAGGFIPSHLRTEGEIVAVILAGRELGLPPMVSLRTLSMIKGKVVMDAAVQLGLMIKHGARIRWVSDGTAGDEAVLELQRGTQPPHQSRYTLAMAKQANLLGNDSWRKHPAAMLRARCVSAAGRAYMPDVFAGVYNPGELDDEPAPAPVLAVVPPQEAAQPAQEGPKVLPSGEGPPPDAPEARTGEEMAALREMHRGKLLACKGRDELATWLDTLDRRYPKPLKIALWGMFVAHAKALGHDPKSFTNGAE